MDRGEVMKLRTKMLIATMLLSIIPLLVGAGLVGKMAASSGHEEITHEVKDRLVSLRESKKQQVERYFQLIQKQVIRYSGDSVVVDATQGFERSFRTFRKDSGLSSASRVAEQRELLKPTYDGFDKRYRQVNGGVGSESETMLNGLSPEAVALQYQFIENNSNPVGSKDALNDISVDSKYADVHARYHPQIRKYLKTFSFYDIFLIDSNSGQVVYSVYKELDFATSLKQGPFADSGLAEVYRKAMKLTHQDGVVITDFAPYKASYEAQAGFIASPIFKNGERIGILVFQMPIDAINDVMTSKAKWKDVGLGESGETYLVGRDKRLRSQSRFLIEDQSGYLKALKESGLAANVIERIKATGSGIGLQPVDTQGVREALAGQEGFKVFPDYRGVAVLSAFAPIELKGLDWVLMAELDEEEAFHGVEEMNDNIFTSILLVVLIIAAIAIGVGAYAARLFTGPVMDAAKAAERIATGDLESPIIAESKDEIGQLAISLNDMRLALAKSVEERERLATTEREQVKLQLELQRQESELVKHFEGNIGSSVELVSGTAEEVNDSATALASTAEELTAQSQLTGESVESGAESVNSTAAASEEMSASISLVTDRIHSAMDISNEAVHQANATNDSMSHFNEMSNQIGSVVQVISDIAEQTNLLALNASIEAARAGDAGRGFAVVAGEVKELANQTARATEEISSQVSQLQGESGRAITAISKISEVIGRMNEISQSIDEAMTQQNEATHEISSGAQQSTESISQIQHAFEDVIVASTDTARMSSSLLETSDKLAHAAEEQKRLVEDFLSEMKEIRSRST